MTREYVLTFGPDSGKSYWHNQDGTPCTYSTKRDAWAEAKDHLARQKTDGRAKDERDRLLDFDVIPLAEYLT